MLFFYLLTRAKFKMASSAQQVRTAIETLLDFSLFMDTDDVKKISMKLSSLIESELSKNFKQASIKDYFTCNV